MGESRKDERPDANQVGGAHGNGEGGPSSRLPNDAQLGGHGPGSLGELARDTDQLTPGAGQSGPGEGKGRGPMSDRDGRD